MAPDGGDDPLLAAAGGRLPTAGALVTRPTAGVKAAAFGPAAARYPTTSACSRASGRAPGIGVGSKLPA